MRGLRAVNRWLNERTRASAVLSCPSCGERFKVWLDDGRRHILRSERRCPCVLTDEQRAQIEADAIADVVSSEAW